MTSKESRRLKKADAVVFCDGVGGTVIEVGTLGVRVVWDDGQEGVIHDDDMQDVARAKTTLLTS